MVASDAAGNVTTVTRTVQVDRTLYVSTFGNTNPAGLNGTGSRNDILRFNGSWFRFKYMAMQPFPLPVGVQVDGISRESDTVFYVSLADDLATGTGLSDFKLWNTATNAVFPSGTVVQDEDIL